jgi:hypothetical protein
MQFHLDDAACLKAVPLVWAFEAVLAFVLGALCEVSVSFVKSSVPVLLGMTSHYVEAISPINTLKPRSNLNYLQYSSRTPY